MLFLSCSIPWVYLSDGSRMELQVSFGLQQAIQRYNLDIKYIKIVTFTLQLLQQTYMASNGPQFYPVQRVINKTLFQGKTYYLVKWKGFNEAEATWESADTLKYIKPLIRKFNQELRQKKNDQKSAKSDSLKKRLPNRGSFGSKYRESYQRGKPLAQKKLPNNFQNNKNRNESAKDPQKTQYRACKQKKLIANQIDKDRNEQFTFQQRNSMGCVNITEDGNAVGECKDEKNLVFKPLCIKIAGYSQNRIISKEVKLSDNRKEYKGQNNQDNKQSSHSIDTTIKDRSVNIENKSKLIPHPNDTNKLKRMSLLQKSDAGSQWQYFIEEESGKLAIVSGSELLKLYPNDFLCYFEEMVIKNLS